MTSGDINCIVPMNTTTYLPQQTAQHSQLLAYEFISLLTAMIKFNFCMEDRLKANKKTEFASSMMATLAYLCSIVKKLFQSEFESAS